METGFNYLSIKLKDREFKRLSEFIHSELGINLTPVKKTMLEARLQKRLRLHNMSSFDEYIQYLFSPSGVQNELVHMMDVVTTNKTEFFREPAHFSYLTEKAVPSLIKETGAGISRPLTVWSAGCSTGEEPYTLAMVLSEISERISGFKFVVLGTDISTQVLEKAVDGIYEEEKADAIPPNMKKKYLLKSKDRGRRLVRVAPAIRSSVKFRRLNFMSGDFGLREKMDIIFCRNVIIYFDRPTQEILLNRFSDHLTGRGYIFMGHSETLNGLNVPFSPIAPTVYRKKY